MCQQNTTNILHNISLHPSFFQTSISTDTLDTLNIEPTEQTQVREPEEVKSDIKISTLKTQVVTDDSVKQDRKAETQRAKVKQSLLGTSQAMVNIYISTHMYPE